MLPASFLWFSGFRGSRTSRTLKNLVLAKLTGWSEKSGCSWLACFGTLSLDPALGRWVSLCTASQLAFGCSPQSLTFYASPPWQLHFSDSLNDFPLAECHWWCGRANADLPTEHPRFFVKFWRSVDWFPVDFLQRSKIQWLTFFSVMRSFGL